MEFRVLGPVQAYADGAPVDLGDRKQRLVLAVLLLEVNQLVPVGRMVRMLWPHRPPPTARRIVQTHVSRLRGTLAQARAAAPEFQLARCGEGYLLDCDPYRVDVHRFRNEVERARLSTDDQERVQLLRLALNLWRGPALADVAEDEVRDELCAALDESRLAATEERFEAELRLGRHDRLIDDLTELCARHPYRQRLVGQLMLALHRVGRTADALRLYSTTRARLSDELGLETSIELQDLHVRILRAETESMATAATAASVTTMTSKVSAVSGRQPTRGAAEATSAIPAATMAADRARMGARTRPCQLPADVVHFVGRATYLAALRRELAPARDRLATPVVLVTGMAGVGKTALVTRWARGAAADYPDGQLYVDLRAHSGEPARSDTEALAALLSGLGIRAKHVPSAVPEAAALYRSLLANRRMLIVLDDAVKPDVVRALLPGSPGCAVVVTSRHRMVGLVARDGASRIEIDPMEPAEAAELVVRTVGAAISAHDAAAVDALVRLCGGLPLALRIASALAADRGRNVAAQVESMAGPGLMDALQIDGDEDAGVPAAFDRSYAALPIGAATMFRLLSRAGPIALTARIAAKLAGLSLDAAQRALRQLVNANLIRQQGIDLFRVPDLLRHYALNRLPQVDVGSPRPEPLAG